MKKVHSLFLSALISIVVFAQNAKDTADRRFHDDLSDHLVGEWDVKSVAQSRNEILGKESEVFSDMKLTAAKTPSN